jgi:hypothetical protein
MIEISFENFPLRYKQSRSTWAETMRNGLQAILWGLFAMLITWAALAIPMPLPMLDLSLMAPDFDFKVDLVGLATLILVIVTWLLVLRAREAATHTRIVERAYVKMSHHSPGLDVSASEARVVMQIRNSGHTPANVTGAVLKLESLPRTASLPATPIYAQGQPWSDGSFLAAEADFQIDMRFALSPERFAEIQSDDFSTYLYGFVDYIDMFGVSHRSGYARRYERRLTINNLVFAGGTDYNYDEDIDET